ISSVLGDRRHSTTVRSLLVRVPLGARAPAPFRGGFAGATHHQRFLADIRVQRTLHLADGLLRQTTASG
uniref:hypothetical protein n=1 Tax=Nocardia cyriacigeorgica TaxID=135487 RepID=UPI002455D1F1